MKIFFLSVFFIFYLFFSFLHAQELSKEGDENPQSQEEQQEEKPEDIEAEEQKDKKEIFIPQPEDYLFLQGDKPSELLVKKLSLDTYYSHNYLRKDFFGFVPFPNIGQPLNPLTYIPSFDLIAEMGFSGKMFNYLKVEDIRYFDVKTPTTEFYYEGKYGMRRDPLMVDALFTHNPSKEVNYSFSYQSLRAPNLFPREEALRNRIIATLSLSTSSQRYKVWLHYLNQNIQNQENFGMKDFRTYKEQVGSVFGEQNLEVLFDGSKNKASSVLQAQRFYLKHLFALNPSSKKENINSSKKEMSFKSQEGDTKQLNLDNESLDSSNKGLDSDNNNLISNDKNLSSDNKNLDSQEEKLTSNRFFISHSAFYEPKKYSYKQSGNYDPFGPLAQEIKKPQNKDSISKANQKDAYEKENEISYNRISNQFDFLWRSREIFSLNLGLSHNHIQYELISKYENPPFEIPAIKNHVFAFLANTETKFLDLFKFKTDWSYAFSKEFQESIILKSNLEARIYKNIKIGGGFFTTQLYPNLNQILHNSFYSHLNYQNPDFKPIETKSFNAYLNLDPYFSLSGNIYHIDYYTYFGEDRKPHQYDKELKIFDLKAKGIIKFWKLGFENTLLYQNVFKGAQVLPLPDFIARSSIYYEDLLFNESLSLQSGITLNYFSRFRSRTFFPILNEFMLSPFRGEMPAQIIGGYPFLDAFVNFSVFRMKFYLRITHLNSNFSTSNYFVSPGYPAKKWDLRFGILWTFFT